MISIFRSYHPGVILLLLLYTAMFRVPILLAAVPFSPPESSNYLSSLIYQLLGWLIGDRNYIYHVAASVLVIFQALYFNFIINHYRILSRPSYLPAMAYVLISSVLIEFTLLTPALIANTFLLFALSKVLSTYKKDKAAPVLFDASLLVSIASLFFFPYIAFFLFILASLVMLRPFNLREFFMSVLGLLLPYYFIGVYFFWIRNLDAFWKTIEITQLNFPVQQLERSIRVLVTGSVLLAVILWNFFYVQANLFRMVVQVRSYLMVFIFLFIAGLFSLLIQFTGELDHFVWIALPVGLAFAIFFTESRRRWIAELLHFFLLLSALFFQYYSLIK